jgi:Ca2+-binding RTX toxin-like protein
MKFRFAVATAMVTLAAAVPASADNVNCSNVKTSTDLCLNTGGWIEMTGTDEADRLTGTRGADQILGDGGNDRINALGGDDELDGGDGRDTVNAGSGDDIVYARDNKRDTIDCGSGKDTVIADPEDRLKNCEKVTRR